MIARHWRGVAKSEAANAYIEHLRDETFPALARLAGFIDASILRREITHGTEFLVVTTWASLESIRAFAGADIDAAVVPALVQDMMIEYDRLARHYHVVEEVSVSAR